MSETLTKVEVTLKRDKETKNTVRYVEDVAEGEAAVVGMLYVPNTTLSGLGNPEAITVTVEAV